MKITLKTVVCAAAFVLATTPLCAQTFITHPWQNKRVAYFGDSVTDPEAVGVKPKYHQFLKEMLGITPYVYGVNGREWSDIPHQAEQLEQEHGQDVDAILIFIGTNDFNAGVPIGKWYSESAEKVVAAAGKPRAEETRMKRTPVMDGATLCGRINIAMNKVKTLFPTKQVVLITPLHRAYAEFGDNNVQPSEEYANSCGEWFADYVEAVKQAGNVWAVPVIDLNADSGLYPLLDSQSVYFRDAQTDRLHPSVDGQRRMALTLMYRLLALPCTF